MINATHYIVVASSDELPGTVVEAGARVQQLAAHGTLLLPVDYAAIGDVGSVGASAFQLAHYGPGARWDGPAPNRNCPLNVYLPTGSARVVWMFEVATKRAGTHMSIALAGAVTERGVADVQHEKSFNDSGLLPDGGVVAGSSIVRAAPRSFATVCLGGVSHDPARVLWLAATVLPL